MTPSSVSVAAVDAAYADILAEIHKQCFPSPWPAEAFAQLVSDPVRPCLLATVDGQPAGLVLLQCVAGESEILTLGVSPVWRRQGIGRALLRAAMALATERGATHMVLEVAEANAAATALYAAHGFETVGRRSGYYADGEAWRDAHILEARLGCSPETEPISSRRAGGPADL